MLSKTEPISLPEYNLPSSSLPFSTIKTLCFRRVSFCPLCLGIHLRNVCEEVQDSARVAPLIVIPRHHLDEVIVQSNSSFGINNGGVVVAVQVSRDNIVVGD